MDYQHYQKVVPFNTLVGKTLTAIVDTGDDLKFTADDGSEFLMGHVQDCCENVRLEETIGDLADLIGSPILRAEEVSNANEPAPSDWVESYTWTFYKLATIRGEVVLRWLGESNGYYSEGVEFVQSK